MFAMNLIIALLLAGDLILLRILHELKHPRRKLARIEVIFRGDCMSVPAPVPASINVGQSIPATVLGFDQFGNPFPIDFTATPVSWSVSDTTNVNGTVSADTSTDVLTGVSPTPPGTPAVVTAVVAGISGQNELTVNQPAAPVLTSIVVAFGTPTP